jgi:hypothetical protein
MPKVIMHRAENVIAAAARRHSITHNLLSLSFSIDVDKLLAASSSS